MERADIGAKCSLYTALVRNSGRAAGLALLVACAVSMLSACGTAFVYNRLDAISRYYVSRQVSLDDAQARALRANLDDFFAWHRRSELPRYATFLDHFAEDARRPVSVSQLEAGQRELESFVSDSVDRMAPSAARWLDGLRPGQVDELFDSLARQDRKARAERCAAPPDKRRAKSARRFIEEVEDWTGTLNRQQRALILSRYVALGRDECADLAARERSHVEFRALVERYRGRPEFAARLADFLGQRRADDEDRERFLALLADINHSLTPAQRARTVDRLRIYAREMRGLAADSEST
jgi:Family of unknown function (DUF6279)